MNNSSEQQVGVLSSLVIRNLLFLTSALVFLLWPFPTKLLATITLCNNCDCTDSAYDKPGAFCSDNVVCSENPSVIRIDTIISDDECPNKFPTVLNEANLTGQVGWSNVLASSVGTTTAYNRVCHNESATIPCVGVPIITGSRTPDYSCCQPPPPPPPPPPPDCGCGGYNCPPCSAAFSSYGPKAGLITKTSGKTQTGKLLKVGTANCCASSPIIIDVGGQGFVLTNASGGVLFDIVGNGHPLQMAWTAQGANNAFLCLPDSNGACNSGRQLFGNYTFQPASASPNGFAALAVYDDPKNGGNGDGVIDARDAIFSSLRLWIDANHDGISQPEELHTLLSLGVSSISLTYKLDNRTDQFGNYFRYRAQVNPGGPTSTGRMAYDVFFVASTSGNSILYAGRCTVPTTTKEALLPAEK